MHYVIKFDLDDFQTVTVWFPMTHLCNGDFLMINGTKSAKI